MSIVEKALAKLQNAKARGDHGGPPKIASLATAVPRMPAGSVAVVSPPASGPGAPVRVETPVRRVHIDLDGLRAKGMLAPENLSRQLTDQYRRIKWPVLDAAFGKSVARLERGNLVMVASSLPNEGKTFTALHLALSIAMERDSSVLLVDADVAKMHVSRLLGLGTERGLMDVLHDGRGQIADVTLATDIEGLEILPSGARSAHAPELFASRRTEELLVEAAQQRPDRIILFDSSPVLATNEAQVLARIVGQVLLVVRADETPQSAVVEALSLLDGSKSISCVLNDVRGGFGSGYYGEYDYQYHETQPGK